MSECPWVRETLWSPLSRRRVTTGWGVVLGLQTVRGVWTECRHIRDQEAGAIWLTLQLFAPLLSGTHVLVLTDSIGAKAVFNHQGDLRSWSLTAGYIPGNDNVTADFLSKGGPHVDEWGLIPIIVGVIWERPGRAQMDLFARRCGRKGTLWYSQALTELASWGANAFRLDPWSRGRLYAVPPPVLHST